MFQVIQILPTKIIVELVYHYNIVLNQLIIYQYRQYEVQHCLCFLLKKELTC